jgi:formylglycine-generating enzyme required for sulfatase activity
MAEAAPGQKLKVFVSYSRRDSCDFADELVADLELAGFELFLDRHDIAAGEDWEARLGNLILQADTVVFIVSPEAVRSERCGWEVDRTLELSKRLLPVVFKPVPDSDIPQALRRLQFVRFDTGRGFAGPLSQLAEALRQDLNWIREHTRLGELAARWQARSRMNSLLLRGDDLDGTKAWAASRRPEAPEITDLVHLFLDASEQAEHARIAEDEARRKQRRRLRALVGVLFVAGLAYTGWSTRTYAKVHIVALSDAFSTKVLSPETERALKPKQRFRECAWCPEMVVVQAGQFMMGSPSNERRAASDASDEFPLHRVTLENAIAVSRFDITYDEWDACVALGGCASRPGDEGFGRGRRPVINVSWDDVQQYVKWLSKQTGKHYRLLSEAEWEYSARAGSDQAYPWGPEIGQGNANCGGCGSRWDSKQTAPVGSFAPNAYGLYDMQGNVFEWVQDCYHKDYVGAPADGKAWEQPCAEGHRVIRGGAWREPPWNLRAAHRDFEYIGTRGGGLGFRVGRTLSVENGTATVAPGPQ